MARHFHGRIDYMSEEKGNVGREYFHVTVETDGTRTLRCLCEMDTVSLVRDVTYTVDKDFRALDCFVRVTNDHKFVGTGWFLFGDTWVEGKSHTAAEGRVSQRLETKGRVRLFGTHPIAVDIWKCAHVKAADPGQLQVLDDCVNCSSVLNGASGPLLAHKHYDMVYQGQQKVTVPAGTFDCACFDWRTGTGRTLQLYTTPGDWLPIKTVVPEGKRWYELAAFSEVHK